MARQGMGNDLVSIGIPVYNIEQWIAQCVDSVVSQTYENLDIVIIDDGSTDASGEIVDSYQKRDPRVRVSRTSNAGLAAARNRVIEASAGEWIVFVDGDDWLEPDYVNRLVSAAHTHNASISACGNRVEGATMTEHRVAHTEVACTSDEAVRRMLLGDGSSLTATGKAYRAEVFHRSGITYPVGRLYEDAATTYKLLEEATTVAYVPDLLYHYRCRPGSITQRPVDHQTVRDTLLMLEEMTAWMAARHPDMGSEFDRFHSAARLHVLYRLAAGRQVDPTLWDPMVAWLDQNSRRLRVNPHLSKRTKVAISLLVRGGHLGRALVGVARRHQGR